MRFSGCEERSKDYAQGLRAHGGQRWPAIFLSCGMTKTRDVDTERQIERAIAPVLATMGYEVVRIRLGGGRQTVLQVMIERADRVPLTVDDCAAASRALLTQFENDNLPASDYTLEVSSPGIDRPLVRLDDFVRFAGFEAKVEMIEPLEGRRRFRGRLQGAGDGRVRLTVDDQDVLLPFDGIRAAKLVLTDELLAASEAAERV